MLAACKQPNLPSNNESDTILDNVDSSVISVPQNTDAIEANSSATEEDFFAPYTMIEISDERIKISNNKKVFSDLGITFSFPVDWIGMALNAEDASIYYFRHPELGEKCEFSFELSFTELFSSERNEQEYLEYLTFDKREKVKIDSFTKEKVGGYQCRKVVSSYSLENTEYIRIDYAYVIVGLKLYDFAIEYPASERETLQPIFDSIINSIKFKTT